MWENERKSVCKFVAEDSLNEGGIIVQYALCTVEIFIDSMKIKLKKMREKKKGYDELSSAWESIASNSG